MRLHGSRPLASPPADVFGAILDPRALLAVVPGCRDVERTGPDTYEGRLSLRLPGIAGSYRTHVRVVDAVAPERAALEGRVEGALGTIVGRANFTLQAEGAGTRIVYEGTASIDGPLARLDSRFVEQLAGSLVDQGLGALDRRLASASAATDPSVAAATERPMAAATEPSSAAATERPMAAATEPSSAAEEPSIATHPTSRTEVLQ